MRKFFKNLQQGVSIGIGFLLIVGFSGAVYAWVGIIASDGDSLDYTKWNEMVAYVSPSGAIVPFNLLSCPTGWSAADGTSGNPDLRGEFIRGFDDGRGIDPGRVFASLQEDSFESHYHETGWYQGPVNSSLFERGSSHLVNDRLNYSSINSASSTDLTGGSETRPRNIAFLYCVKD